MSEEISGKEERSEDIRMFRGRGQFRGSGEPGLHNRGACRREALVEISGVVRDLGRQEDGWLQETVLANPDDRDAGACRESVEHCVTAEMFFANAVCPSGPARSTDFERSTAITRSSRCCAKRADGHRRNKAKAGRMKCLAAFLRAPFRRDQ